VYDDQFQAMYVTTESTLDTKFDRIKISKDIIYDKHQKSATIVV